MRPRLMLEDTDDLILGIRLMMRASGATRAIVGIEENKPDAIALLEERFAGLPQVEVKKVKLKYPQGEERLLIKAATGREVAPDELPSKAGVIVNNVATVAALGQAFRTGMPLIERVVTVTGPGVEKPGNWRVRLGAPVEELLGAAAWRGTTTLLAGGP